MYNERGIALGIVTVMAFMLALAAAALMTVGLSRSSTSAKMRNRLQARYVAEAGLVKAMQKLWVDTAYCPPAPGDSVPLGGLEAKVSMTDCAGTIRTISSKVVY